MRNIKNTLVAVTADWCGACHSISGRLNNAIKNSTIGTRIDETLLDKFNSTLKTSIQPPHFPYFIVINQSGKMVKVLRDIDAVEEFLENTPNSPRNNASMSTSAMNKNINAVINNNSNSFKKNNVNSLLANSANNNVKSLIANNNNEKMNSVMNSINQSIKKSFVNNNNGNEKNQENQENEEEDEEFDMDPNKISIVPDNTGLPMKMESVGIPNVGKGPSASLMNNASNSTNASNPINVSNSMKNATRPNAMSDARMNASNLSNSANAAKQAGGCLYESLAASAYNLATPAALLGIAAATLSKKKGRKTKRRSRSA